MPGRFMLEAFDRATIPASTGATVLSKTSIASCMAFSYSFNSPPSRILRASQLVDNTLAREALRIPSGVKSNSVWSVKSGPCLSEKYFLQTSRLQALLASSQATEIVLRVTGIMNSVSILSICPSLRRWPLLDLRRSIRIGFAIQLVV